ncbi:hypothetical protein ACTHGU_20730 [Chitinophagaceae bacterium MMS25-I14]
MKRLPALLIPAAIAVIQLTSCQSKPLDKGTPMEASKTAMEALLNDKTKDSKRFSVTGYLWYSVGFGNIYVNRPQSVNVLTTAGDASTSVGLIAMGYGENEANHVFFPDSDADAKKAIFYDNEGKPHGINDKLTISFTVDQHSNNLEEVRIDPAQ